MTKLMWKKDSVDVPAMQNKRKKEKNKKQKPTRKKSRGIFASEVKSNSAHLDPLT